MARRRTIGEILGQIKAFWGSQRPISRDSNVPLSSNFSHSCMARRRTIGEILGQIKASELEISLQTQERGLFGGHKGPYLETRMSHFLQTFHTAVWPGDGQSVKFWARSKLPNSRYPSIPANTGKGPFWGSQRPISRDSNTCVKWLLCVFRALSAILCLPCVKWILCVYRALSGYCVFTMR